MNACTLYFFRRSFSNAFVLFFSTSIGAVEVFGSVFFVAKPCTRVKPDFDEGGGGGGGIY